MNSNFVECYFTVVLTPDPDDGGFTVTVPALLGVFTQGDTYEEALAMARDAIQCHMEGLIGTGIEIEVHVVPEVK